MSHTYEHPRPSVTATIVLYRRRGPFGILRQFWIGLRAPTAKAFPKELCLVGGFLDAKSETFAGETIEQTAIREVKEETGLDICEADLQLMGTSSHPDTDPRAHVVNIIYAVKLTKQQAASIVPGDDLTDGLWTVDYTTPLAFNHTQILKHVAAKIWGV